MKEAKQVEQYIRALGLTPAKNRAAVKQVLIEKLGRQQGEAAAAWLEDDDVIRLYQQKNQTLEHSLAISGAYDTDLYRRACSWIAQNRHQFGSQILEVGCDCGILSCFLAQLLPQAQITAIDRTAEAIQAARVLAARLGVTNVTFLETDLAGLPQGQYDTVFSMRTIHENVIGKPQQVAYQPLLQQAEYYGNTIADYCQLLLERVREGGTILSIERGEADPMFLGWLLHLYHHGFSVAPGYCQLDCTVLGEPRPLQAMCAVRTGQQDNIYGFWCAILPLEAQQQVWTGWAAETMLQNLSGLLLRRLEGFLLVNDRQEVCGKYAVWSMKDNPQALLYYQGGQQRVLGLYDRSMLPQIRQQLQTIQQRSRQQGLRLRAMKELF